MRRPEKQKGNTLALVVVCIGVIAVLVAFFALNYGQFLGTHKRAQTAIDAAALQAARDIGRVVIQNGRFGRVALCDDVPPGGDLNARPVWGLNTLLATARLDMIIADELDNSTMLYLAKRDLDAAQKAGKDLAATIMDAVGQPGAIDGGQAERPAKDKNGTTIPVLANAVQAYNENSRRLGTGEMVPNSMKITVGQLTGGTAETNTPTPLPERLDGVDDSNSMVIKDSQRVYKAYVSVDTTFGEGAANNPVVFAAVTDEPRLADTSKFSTLGLTTNIPSVVKVEVDERVTQIAPDGQGQKETRTVHVAACAQAGGPRGTQPSGVLAVVFPAGMPPGSGSVVDFSSVQTVMNNSMLGPNAGGGTAAPAGGWNARGQWNQIVGGAFPSGTNGGPIGQQVLTPFNGRTATGVDNGSTSLAFMIYDWLRSCGLRPNIANTVAALQLSIRDQTRPGEFSPPAMSHNSFFMAPAYAQDESPNAIASGILAQYPTESYDSPNAPDTRLMGSSANAGFDQEYMEQFRVFMRSTDPGETFAASPGGEQIRRASYDTSTGSAIAVGGADLGALIRLWDAVTLQETLSVKAYAAASALAGEYKNLADQKLGERTIKQTELDNARASLAAVVDDPNSTADDTRREQLQADITRLTGEIDTLRAEETALRAKEAAVNVVKDNAVYIGDTQVAIKGNIGAITGAGLTETNGGFMLFGDTPFVPCRTGPENKDALKAMLDAGQDVPAGQVDASATSSSNKWNSPKENGKCTLIICRRSAAPTIGRRPDGGGAFLPALAQAAQPQAGTAFIYIVQGDASRTGALGGARGAVKRIVTFARQSNYAFFNHNLMEGQFIFNNPNAMRTQVPGNAAIRWSLNAADWNATGATYNVNGADQQAGYSANVNENGYNVNPLNWCHREAFMGGAQPEGGDAPCYYPSAVWSLCCPDPEVPQCADGTTPPSSTVIRADGTVALVVEACPPPPRRSH